MKNIYSTVFFVLVFFALPNVYSQAPFWTETFSNGCSSGCIAYTGPNGIWTITNTGTNGIAANNWYFSSAENGNNAGMCGSSMGTDQSLHIANVSGSSAASLFCPSGDCAAAYDDTGAGEITNKRVESPIINCTGYSNVNLSFNYIENGQASSDDATVWYYDGTGWSLLSGLTKSASCPGWQGLWTGFSITLPPSANNNPNVKIGFNWTNNGDGIGTDPSIAIDDITLSIASVGITEINKNKIRIYPNPISERLQIESPENLILEYNVYDITGKSVAEEDQNDSFIIEINTSFLEKGIYFLQIETIKGSETFKLIRQ
jgi:hypothetical protein